MNVLKSKKFLLRLLVFGFVGFIQSNCSGYYDNPKNITVSNENKTIHIKIYFESYNFYFKNYKVDIDENSKKQTVSFCVKNNSEFELLYAKSDKLFKEYFYTNFLNDFDWNQPYVNFMIDRLKKTKGINVLAVPVNFLYKGLNKVCNAIPSKRSIRKLKNELEFIVVFFGISMLCDIVSPIVRAPYKIKKVYKGIKKKCKKKFKKK